MSEEETTQGAKDAPDIPTLVVGEMNVPLLFFNSVPVVVEDKKEKVHAYEVTFKTRIAEEQFPWLISMLREHKLVAAVKNPDMEGALET